MSSKVRVWTILVVFLFALFIGSKAYATTAADFPSCLNPQGTIVSQYDDGVHGIAGDTNTYVGTDTVYSVASTMNLQCFCPPSGNGIQTQWLKLTNQTQDEISQLQGQGWISIADGSVWGLSEGKYMAKNMSYTCIGGKGGGDNSNSGSGSSGSSSSSSSSSSSDPISSILSLADTGNIKTVLFLFISGIALFVAGSLYKRSV